MVTAAHWEEESCEGASGVTIGGERLTDQYFMEPGYGPDGVLPKEGTGCHLLHASPVQEVRDNDDLQSGQLRSKSEDVTENSGDLSYSVLGRR